MLQACVVGLTGMEVSGLHSSTDFPLKGFSVHGRQTLTQAQSIARFYINPLISIMQSHKVKTKAFELELRLGR